MTTVEVNQIRVWSKINSIPDMFIIIGYEKNVDLPTCAIKYIGPELQGLIISDYFADYIEEYSEIVEDAESC